MGLSTNREVLEAIFKLFKEYFQEHFKRLLRGYLIERSFGENLREIVEELENYGFDIEIDKDGKIIVKSTPYSIKDQDLVEYFEISIMLVAESEEFKNSDVPISYVKRCLTENFADVIVFIFIPLNLNLEQYNTKPQDLVKMEIDGIIGERDIFGNIAINVHDKISIKGLFDEISKTILKVLISIILRH